VEQFLSGQGIVFKQFKDHVIFDKKEVLNDNNEPYKVFSAYKRKWFEKMNLLKFSSCHSEQLLNNLFKSGNIKLPELPDIGFRDKKISFPEKEFDHKIIRNYDKTRDFPFIDGTTRLGIHFRHGTISIRKAVEIARQHNNTWLNELIWREFYAMILYHFPEVVTRSFKPQYDNIVWINNMDDFACWQEGKTGYPIVDAGMRQLNQSGYMHNRVRMITASFLTKHLLIDWRWGEAYFAKKLLDYDLASNNGGWQWAAGVGTDAQPYFRIFNPYEQTRKFDAELKYVRKWLPEYSDKNYPKPIIDHKFARIRAIESYKKALL
jgi:deoxyribodipyrimidine photo-lyase